MTKKENTGTKHVSEKAKKGTSRLHDKIMGGHEEGSRKGHLPLRTSSKDL